MSPLRLDSDDMTYTLPKLNLSEAMSVSVDHQVSSSKGVCRMCISSVLEAGKSWGYHHSSLKDVEVGDIQKCLFCRVLYSDTMLLKNEEGLWYIWNIRSSGASRDTESVISVAFSKVHRHNNGRMKHQTGTTHTFYMLPEEQFGDIPENCLGPSTDPQVSGATQIQRWLEECDKRHGGCRKPTSDDFVPTRLLDLEVGDSNFVRLIITAEEGVKGPYCTLSHSWGLQKFLTTTPDNLEEFKTTGIAISRLSKNFRQAIQVARCIGMRYIWIDSLTIIQRDGGRDFTSEGQLMHKVYSFSYCNIVAADSADSTGGLFRNRDSSTIIPARYIGRASPIFGTKAWRILSKDLWDDELLHTKIYNRAWVFQERMLSPQLIHFAQHQVFWDCGTLSACEAIPSGLPQPVDSTAATDRHWRGRLQALDLAVIGGPNDDSIEEFWSTAVSNYTACDLTNQGDKTIAIWSVAKLVGDSLKQKYACGMWEYGLEEQLAWRVADIKKSTRPPKLNFGNPSWSWASVKGPVVPHDRLTAKRVFVVRDPYGFPIRFAASQGNADDEPRLTSRSIRIEAYICRGTLLEDFDVGGYRVEPQAVNSTTKRGVCGIEKSDLFVAFPDELPASDSHIVSECTFIILAASPQHPKSERSSDSVTAQVDALYSGIGLLLQTPHDFSIRYPKHFPASASNSDKVRLDEAKYHRKLLSQLKGDQRKTEQGEHHYRRTGAIHFRNVSESVWQELQAGSKVKLWLD